MPWIPEEQKERKHSEPVRERYAKSARAHREAYRRATQGIWWIVALAILGMTMAYACVVYLLIK